MSDEIHNSDPSSDEVDDLIAVTRQMTVDDVRADLEEQIARNQAINLSQTMTDLRFIGDREIIGQVVQLLAYIRNALRSGTTSRITVDIGTEISNPVFTFDVNGCEIKDITAVSTTRIN